VTAVLYESPTIGIIGLGHFGKALAEGIIANTYSKVWATNRHPVEGGDAKMEKWGKGFKLCDTNQDLLSECPIIIVAVRPQDMSEVLTEIKDYDGVLISFAAGLPHSYYKREVTGATVIRAMSNLGVAYGRGMTAWAASDDIDVETRWVVQSLFSDLGNSLQVDLENENHIDVVTALSGSGIAYLAQVFDTMKSVGVSQGMSEAEAELTVLETVSGVLAICDNTELSLNDIVEGVASKGGTTEAGLKTMDKKGLKTALTQGLEDTISKSNSFSNPK